MRPGTLPVALIAGFGEACFMALRDHEVRREKVTRIRRDLLHGLERLHPIVIGADNGTMPNVANCIFPEDLDVATLKSVIFRDIAVSSGSACNSYSNEASHVLTAMGLPDDVARRAIRLSWCHLSEQVDWFSLAIRAEKICRRTLLKVG
ncbi:hypothetical protein ACFFJT_15490 [Dyella flava]|uniref:hypothetical protein n=1 Tax=Dyella flava TaxID=1920170 RepID=UPI001959E07A|nr:hypothetical protein [Dyella flava]GLQ51644.1 hypothetical protein GCM10010872_30930 [Dyella flava]